MGSSVVSVSKIKQYSGHFGDHLLSDVPFALTRVCARTKTSCGLGSDKFPLLAKSSSFRERAKWLPRGPEAPSIELWSRQAPQLPSVSACWVCTEGQDP